MQSIPIPSGLRERVIAMVEETVAGTPVFIVDVVVRGHAGSRVVEIYLDSDQGLGLDELASISRELGVLFESSEIVSGAYRLNVSTPGLDRPLIPRQFPRNVGRPMRIRIKGTASSESTTATVEGTLVAADVDHVVVRDAAGRDHEVSVNIIHEAKVLLPW